MKYLVEEMVSRGNAFSGKCPVRELSDSGNVCQGTISQGTGHSWWQFPTDSPPTNISLIGLFATIKQCPSSVFLNGKVMHPAQQRKTNPTLCWNQSIFPDHRLSSSNWFLTNFISCNMTSWAFLLCSLQYTFIEHRLFSLVFLGNGILSSVQSISSFDYCQQFHIHFLWLFLNKYSYKIKRSVTTQFTETHTSILRKRKLTYVVDLLESPLWNSNAG